MGECPKMIISKVEALNSNQMVVIFAGIFKTNQYFIWQIFLTD